MLYVNGQRLNTANRSGEYGFVVEDYHKELKEQREYFGKYLVVETKIKPRKDKETGFYRYPGPRGMLKQSNVKYRLSNGEETTVELRYSDVLLQVDMATGNIKNTDPNILIKRGKHTVDMENEPDLAYFFLKSNSVGRTPAQGKKFHIYDLQGMQVASAGKRKLMGEVIHLIYSSLPENKVRILAKSYGIPDVNLKSFDVVKEELYAKLEKAEEQKARQPGVSVRGFDEFINSAEVKKFDQVAALCRDAQDMGKVVFQENERNWVIDYQDGKSPYVLKELSGDEFGDPLNSLVTFLVSNPNYLRKVENVMGVGGYVGRTEEEQVSEPAQEPESDLTQEMVLQETNYMKLKKMFREVKPDGDVPKGTNAETLRRMILSEMLQGA